MSEDFVDDFDGAVLDRSRWLPHYLPAWSSDWHTYAVDWTADEVAFSVDGVHLRTCSGPPRYPMQMIMAVFDFPERAPGHEDHVPRLIIDRVACSALD